MRHLLTYLILWGGGFLTSVAQDMIVMNRYEQAYQEMSEMLDGKREMSLKRAVFVAENAYLDGELDFEKDFCKPIRTVSEYLYRLIDVNHWNKYKTAKQIALCNFFFYPCSGNEQKEFVYDFDNEYSNEDWRYQLVSQTIKTHKGQCRTLPWLFKLYAEEIDAKVYIAHAPRHCFIMYKDEDDLFPEDWVNVSLSSQQYQPTIWIKDFFEIKDSAIVVGTYLTPLTDVQAVATQLGDLAMVYAEKFKKYDEFTLKCAEKSLEYFLMNPNAIIIKGKSIVGLLIQHLKENGFRKDAYTDMMDVQNDQCWAMLQATHWTQETPELRKRWTQNASDMNQMKNSNTIR